MERLLKAVLLLCATLTSCSACLQSQVQAGSLDKLLGTPGLLTAVTTVEEVFYLHAQIRVCDDARKSRGENLLQAGAVEHSASIAKQFQDDLKARFPEVNPDELWRNAVRQRDIKFRLYGDVMSAGDKCRSALRKLMDLSGELYKRGDTSSKDF